MKYFKSVPVVCFLVFMVCVCFSAAGSSFRQMVLTITIPDDHTSGTYQTELIVPEGSSAVNFTVWGADHPWGITSENAVASGESLFVYRPGLEGQDEYIDSESSESVDTGGGTEGYGYDSDSELTRLSLPPGTYYVWVQGPAGTTITLQYLLEER
ncbi:MAG: hypothetical protein JW885_12120 [Deltaproteobacteria bacterium]|nr:hypothetical protein [Candidatus Zymogenaceae bacterium]